MSWVDDIFAAFFATSCSGSSCIRLLLLCDRRTPPSPAGWLPSSFLLIQHFSSSFFFLWIWGKKMDAREAVILLFKLTQPEDYVHYIRIKNKQWKIKKRNPVVPCGEGEKVSVQSKGFFFLQGFGDFLDRNSWNISAPPCVYSAYYKGWQLWFIPLRGPRLHILILLCFLKYFFSFNTFSLPAFKIEKFSHCLTVAR